MTYFFYDDDEPIVETDSAGNVTALNVFGPDGLVARQSSSAWTYYNFDEQGNVCQRVNSAASITSASNFDAYGAESLAGSGSDPWAYNGQWGYYTERSVGLCYCQHRWYDPGVGRWLNRDPVGNQAGLNVYGYCGSSPIEYGDPLGLWQTVVVHGDDDGVFGGNVGNWWSKPKGRGVKELDRPTKKQLLDALTDADAFYFWGHGDQAGDLKINGTEYFELDDVRDLARRRKAAGKKKMKYVNLNSCWSAARKNKVNAWLEISEEVDGYPDVTFDNWFKRWCSFNKPVSRDPGTAGGGKKAKTNRSRRRRRRATNRMYS